MASGKPVGSFYVQLGLNTKDFRKNLQGAKRDLRSAFGSAAIQTSQNLAASMTILAGAVLAVAGASVKLAANLEVQTKSFERLLGGTKAAKEELEILQDFAAKTPFTFTELVEYTKRLLAVGYAADETRPLLTTLGDTASGIGLDAGGMGRLIKAFGDIRNKGSLATQELNQLAEAGVGARQILADGLGKTIPEVMNMVEDRAIDSATAITMITEGLSKKFGGMMQIQSQTLIGMFSTVRDETENIMRVIGDNIKKSLDLSGAVKKIRDALSDLRMEIQDKGLIRSFTQLFGPGMKIFIAGIAGTITAALIPAMIALGASVALALGPIAPLALAFGGVAAAITAAYLAWQKFGPTIKGTLASLPELTKATFKLIEAGVEALASVVLRITGKLFKTIFENLSNSSSRIAKTIAPIFDSMSEVFKTSGDFWKNQSKESLNAAASYGEAMQKIIDVYNAEKTLSDFTEWTGIENLLQLWQRIERTTKKTRRYLSEIVAPVFSVFKNVSGQGVNATRKKTTGTGKKTTNPLIEEAKRTTEAIERQWVNQTKSKQEQLDYQFKNEIENLNKSKAFNKNYQQDLIRLSEVYSQKGREMMEAEFIEKQNYFDMQEQQEYAYLEARDNAYYESLKNKQNGWELEQQLMQDMNAADLEAFIAHLDEKAAIEREKMNGRREMMELYDQLQRDSHRSTLSYMTEGYSTFYSGMTNALTNIITGTQKAGEAFKALGLQLIQMVVKWMVQKKLAAVMSKSLEVVSTTASVAQAGIISAAWAPAAAMVAAATFGASTAAAGAGLAGLTAMTRGLAIPGFANGGIVTKPTLAMVGEGNEPEGIFPLSKLKNMNMGGSGDVQVNIINQTNQPVQAQSKTRFDGARTIVDLWIEGVNRNISGVQDMVGGR